MRSLLLFVTVAVWGMAAPAVGAQSVSVQAEATPSEAGTQEEVVYTLRINGASLSDVDTPEPPATTNLVLKQSTPSTKRDLSFQSGKLDRSIAFQWRFRPMRVGTARFRPVEVTVRGETYTTSEIRVRVVPQSQRPSTPSSPPHGAPTTRRSDPGRGGESRESMLEPQDLFIQATTGAEEVYQNEQVTVEYRLFFRPGIQLRHSRLADAWDANGFWREELDVASRPVPRTREIDGEVYQTIVLKRVAVFPTRIGSLSVDPLTIETEAYASRRESAGSYSLQSRYEPVTLSSEALTLRSRPLPDGAPPSFDGAVGSFTLTTRVSPDSVRVGEAVKVRARVEGRGNLTTLQPPSFDAPPAFELYDPDVSTDLNRDGDRVRGAKTFTYVLVPREGGTHTVPPVTFSYFDPESGSYRTLQSPLPPLHVTGEAGPTAVSTTGGGMPIGDVAGLMEMEAGQQMQWRSIGSTPLYRRVWPYAALAVPLLLCAGLAALRRRMSDGAGDADGSGSGSASGDPSGAGDDPVVDLDPGRNEYAMQTAQDHLQEAHRHLREGSVKLFYREVEQAVLGFIGAQLDLPVPGMVRSRIDDHLTRRDVPTDLCEDLYELLDACDQAQYTPSSPSHDSMRAALHRAEDLILRFDDPLG